MAPDTAASATTQDLRGHLRAVTVVAHDLLDAAMQAASGWQRRSDYAQFLALQHAARVPAEAWLAAHAPADLRPPAQTGLILQDLEALGHPVPPPAPALAVAASGAGGVLGVAWVLAGSALGNRAIARQVARIGGGRWPTAFLDDAAMLGFWQGLRARIERPALPAEAAGAAAAASALFAHFLAAAHRGAPTIAVRVGA